ncbi:hypothetical protein ACHAWF_005708 [Thalassiosira exigua]
MCECCGREVCMPCWEKTDAMMTKLFAEMVKATGRGDERAREKSLQEMSNIERCPYCRALPIGPDEPEETQDRIRFERLSVNVKEGKPWAQHYSAVMYQKGMGTPKDLGKAIELLKAAAIQNYFPAHHDLAAAYGKGEGVKKSNKEALKHYELAALTGSVRSQSELAIKYMDQPSFFVKGTPGSRMNEDERFKEAVRHFTIAAHRGYDFAQKRLGMCFWEGKGVDKNIPCAKHWMIKAAVEGNSFNQKEAEGALVRLMIKPDGQGPFDQKLEDCSGFILGDSPLPRAMYWAIKHDRGMKVGAAQSLQDIAKMKGCANCGGRAKPLKSCVKCKCK